MLYTISIAKSSQFLCKGYSFNIKNNILFYYNTFIFFYKNVLTYILNAYNVIKIHTYIFNIVNCNFLLFGPTGEPFED